MADPIRYTPVVQSYSWAEGDPDDYRAVMRIDPSGAFVRFEVDPWLPIEECGELEEGAEYLVRMKRGVLEPLITIARWSGAEWQVRIVDAERYYYRAEHITHVHGMGPIRGPGET